ncbi:DNA translocase FtsK [Chryseomicrobium sp. FSL W7-1435]|uniref:DNA translocase FtsK n=1 Tax=Chryseomicrobium sp. FSL W7-1435 TaxID=2921704 RepID=UPI003159E298
MEWVKRLFRQEQEIDDIEESSFEEVKVTKQPPFRFPLISDDEKNYLLSKQPSAPVEPSHRPVYETSHQQRQSYETNYTAPKWSQETYKKPKEDAKPKPMNRSTKRYVPSVVPSPVFGLKKEQDSTESIARTMRTSHYDWSQHNQQEIEEEVTLPINSVKMDEPTYQQQAPMTKVAIPQEAEPVVPQITTPNKEPEVELEVEQPLESEVAATSSSDIPETIVEVTSEYHSEQDETIQTSEIQNEQPLEQKEKIKPFNVLMLSTDKKKLQQKQTQVVKENVPTQEHKPVEKTVILDTPVLKTAVVETPAVIPAYAMPNANFLHTPVHTTDDTEWMEQQAEHLMEALAHFQIQSDVISIVQGPAVTQFELTVAQGTKVSKIRNLTDDLKLALAAKDIRIQAPIPGRRSIGIEIPNRTSRAVQLAEVIEAPAFKQAESPLEVAMGLDLHGQPVTMDLRKMPHGLIAGATGSGKSVFINSLLISLLYKASPADLKLLLIDPKMVELAPFNHIPHLISPVITDVKAAAAALKWAVEEMERRYQLFAHAAVRDIARFNHQALEAREFSKKLPYIVIVIDELADMMMAAPQDVEDSICRIAQKARACGIHLVLATQRPSVDVITGLIKSNVPTRIAFAVSSQIDSRTILDQQGAERLLGKGDMLYLGSGMASPIRIQGTFVSDEEIDRIIAHARSQGEPDYLFKQEDLIVRAVEIEEQDEMFEEACRFIIENGAASTSLLQRKFHLGYNRAARLMDAMEAAGIITGQNGSKPREVLVSEEFLQEIL